MVVTAGSMVLGFSFFGTEVLPDSTRTPGVRVYKCLREFFGTGKSNTTSC